LRQEGAYGPGLQKKSADADKKSSKKDKNADELADLTLCTLEEEQIEDLALRVAVERENFFLCDSGATSHMTNDKSRLVEVESTDRTV